MSAMAKLFVLTLLCLSVLCMIPLMGSHHLASDHLDHDVSISCSTCMGSAAMIMVGFLLTLLGLSSLIIPAATLLTLVVDQFHPPRMR